MEPKHNAVVVPIGASSVERGAAPRCILITGANGFVGAYARSALARRFPDARLVDLCSSRESCRYPTSVAADLLDGATVMDVVGSVRPDVVIHLAAQSSVILAQNGGSELTWAVNVGGTLNLALAVARHVPHATVLYASSAEVYGRSFNDGPAREETHLAPTNAYAKSKATSERLLADLLPNETKLLVARPFNHTGPGQSEDFVLPSFAGQIARIEAGLQEPRLRVGNLRAVRDFLDVRDVVDAYVGLLAARSKLPSRFVANVASDRPHRLDSLLRMLQRLATRRFSVEVDPGRLRPTDIPIASGNADLLRDTIGWMPEIRIETTLLDLLNAARQSVFSDADAVRSVVNGVRSVRV